MRFLNGTEVFSSKNEKIGTVERVVLDPATDEVSHLVVSKGFLFTTDKVIPIEWVSQATEDRVTIKRTEEAFEDLPDFEEEYYVITDWRHTPTASYARPYYAYPPAALMWGVAGNYNRYSWPNYVSRTIKNIPAGSVALKEGTKVYSRDGEHIGDVERVMVNEENKIATHLLIDKGFLLKEQKLVPTLWIERADDDEVHLYIESDVFENIPEYEAETA